MPSGPPDQLLPSATVAKPPEEIPTIVATEKRSLLEFTPGTILLDRYRIVSRLGRGGMGEVYRADDLKLGLPVALKFVVPRLAGQQQQLLEEVRVGRKVSHPNVCRLHDIGEIEGRLFMSMEYIDGEDLASLLRRIGRLQHDKAVSLAREITSGLVAAHDGGIVHRDLKPANVMIDGRGSAHLTDFGLASAAEAEAHDRFSGTPPYMAPEQFAGAPATTASDVYALGLIFFELWTGRRLIAGTQVSEVIAAHRPEVVRAAVRNATELDPQIGAVIDTCLDDDPARRPPTARAVLAMLPGRDALDSAAASGQTPSPAMVAASSDRGDLTRAQAWTTCIATMAALILLIMVGGKVSLHRRIELRHSAAELHSRSVALLEAIGWGERELSPRDSAGWFLRNDRFIRWRERAAERENTSLVRSIFFIHRQSPRVMVSRFVNDNPMLSEGDPPMDVPGMAGVKVDSAGRLFELEIVPPVRLGAVTSRSPDWSILLRSAGLDPRMVTPVAPKYAAPMDNDARVAWEGRDPLDGTPLHIEAAALRGKPVWFIVMGPWSLGATGPVPGRPWDAAADVVVTIVVSIVIVGGLLLLRRNLRRGQGDTRGALRFALFVFALASIAYLMRAHHVADVIAEAGIVAGIMMRSLFLAFLMWSGYLAIEPLVRRRWPRALISWSRLLEGRFLDPMVGRDVLIGIAASTATFLLAYLTEVAVARGTGSSIPLDAKSMEALTSPRFVVYYIIAAAIVAATRGPGLLIMLVMARGIVRNQIAAAVVVAAALFCFVFPMMNGPMVQRVLVGIVVTATPVIVLVRFGLLAVCAMTWLSFVMLSVPIIVDLRSWHFVPTVCVLAFIFGIIAFAFHRSLGGKSILAGPVFEE